MSNLFRLNWVDIVGALVSAIIVSVCAYALNLGSIWLIDWHKVVDIAAMTAIASLLKSFTTDTNGKWMGVLTVK